MNNWEDFRYVLALARQGSMVSAAASLGVTSATVSRHIDRITKDAGILIFEFRDARWEVTRSGQEIVATAQRIEADIAAAQASTRFSSEVAGKVVINTLSFVNSYFLAPRLGGLVRDHPALSPVLDSTDRNVSLASGEADVGIRLLQPEKGRLIRIPICSFPIGLFAPEGGDTSEWVGFPERLDWVPEMVAARTHFGKPPKIRTDSFAGIAEVAATTGLSGIVPSCIASHTPTLRPIDRDSFSTVRRAWCVIHENNRANAKVRAITDWICTVLPAGQCACGTCPDRKALAKMQTCN